MILNAIFCVLTIAVAFFHYIQGFFSATISAILIAIAAVVAVAYHEALANMLLAAKVNDQANSIAIVLIFGGVYIIPRLVFDAMVPGNVRYPVVVDKVGAGLMGAIAGVLALGILALSADALPFGATVGMYSRMETTEQHGQILTPGGLQLLDVDLHDVVVPDTIDADQAQHLWLRQDDAVMGLAMHALNGGALSSDREFASIHPDYIDELYGQRLGIQVGAKHTVLNSDASKNVSIDGVYSQPRLSEIEGLQKGIRTRIPPLKPVFAPEPGQSILIIRTKFSGKDLADPADTIFRFSPGSVRLLLGKDTDAGPDFKDYHPIGLLDPTNVLIRFNIDDYLFADPSAERTIDFVFAVDDERAFKDSKKSTLVDGAFMQVKRLAYLGLGGAKVTIGPSANPDKNYAIQQPDLQQKISQAQAIPVPGGGASASAVGGPVDETGASITFVDFKPFASFAKIDVNTADASGKVDLQNGVKGEFANKKWTTLTVNPQTAIADLAKPGTQVINSLAATAGSVLMVAHCKAPTAGDADLMWQWATKVGDFVVTDAGGVAYHPVGAWATVRAGTTNSLLASFGNMDGDKLHAIAQPSEGRPTDFYIAFSVPPGKQLADFSFGDTKLNNALGVKVPAK